MMNPLQTLGEVIPINYMYFIQLLLKINPFIKAHYETISSNVHIKSGLGTNEVRTLILKLWRQIPFAWISGLTAPCIKV